MYIYLYLYLFTSIYLFINICYYHLVLRRTHEERELQNAF